MLKKNIVVILTIILFFSCTKNSSGLKQSEVPYLLERFLLMHVQYHEFNDELSEKILKNFITILDHGKYYFYKKDIDAIQKHKYKIDDYIKEKKFDFVINIFDVYKQRFKENIILFNKLIKKKFDFNKDEKIILDRDKVKFAANKTEMEDRWRKNIKLQLLNYISSGLKVKKAKTKLKKKYSLIEKRFNEINREKLLAKFVNACSTALDPHSNYLTQGENEDFKISMQLKLEGIGVRLSSEDGFVIVESIIPGGATDKLPKDIILKPNDKIVAVAQGEGEPVDVIDMSLRDVVKKIRGKKGTEVRLTILRKTGEKTKRMIVPIIREEIKLQDSDAESEIYSFKKNAPKGKIGYLRLPSFYQDSDRGKSSANDVKFHIKKLRKNGANGIILDLRGNPGGLLNEAIKIAGLFIDNGPVLQIKDGRHNPQIINDNDDGIFYEGPVVLLIDKFSASASEILAGAIKDYKRGIIIGPGNTFGKGTVQSYNELPHKLGAIKVTTHIFYQPSGTSNQLNGIKPDLIIPSISTIWDIGESKTRYPLKWEKIKSAKFKSYKYVTGAILFTLKKMSAMRIRKDSEFIKLKEKIKKFKAQISNKSISLKEESNIEKHKKKEIEKKIHKKRRRKIIDLKEDIFLKESFNVTLDYIRYMKSK